MAVIPMQKVRLLVHATDVDVVLDLIQKHGATEFKPTTMIGTVPTTLSFPQAELLPRVNHAINFLLPYAPETPLWHKLRQGTNVVLTEADVARYLEDTDAVRAIVDDVEAIQVEFADKNETVRVLEEKYKLLLEWRDLPIKLSDLKTNKTQTFLFKHTQTSEDNPLQDILSNYCQSENIPYFVTVVSHRNVALTVESNEHTASRIKKITDITEAELVTLPVGVETPDVEFVAVSEKLAKAKGEIGLLFDQAEHFALSNLKTLQEAAEIFSWQYDRYQVIAEAGATKFTLVFEGWLMAEKRVHLESVLTDKKLAAVFVDLEMEPDEEPPVEIRNSTWVQPFEVVTRLYGMPGYKDLDPTAFLAGFFFLFFGFSLTDVGYGLALMLGGATILTLFKVTKSTRTFAKLMLFIGFATVLMGVLFGGYLGFNPELLPEWMQKLQLFDPIGNPLPVFYFALGLGVLQTMFGLVLKIFSEARQGRMVDAVISRGPWLFVFTMGILQLFTVLDFVNVLSTMQITKLIYVGLALIVLSGFNTVGGFFQKMVAGLAGLYEGIGYFSDVLSYSRLLALGLSTSALAYAINLIAEMVRDVPYVGFIIWLLILAIGHLFTLAVNTLGAFVHSARLQFVEFFGKFISGTGKEFTPLTRKERFITIDDD